MSADKEATTNNVAADIDCVTSWIMAGNFDGHFDKLTDAMDNRRHAREEAVLAQVREVFGQDAIVEVPKDLSEIAGEAGLTEANPFFKKRQAVTDAIEPTDNNNDEPTDALDSLPVSNVERQMIDEGGVEALPIEQRGAIIGGLSSSDIGE